MVQHRKGEMSVRITILALCSKRRYFIDLVGVDGAAGATVVGGGGSGGGDAQLGAERQGRGRRRPREDPVHNQVISHWHYYLTLSPTLGGCKVGRG